MTYEPFHVRERNRLRQGQPVLYKYDEVPDRLRVQVMRILESVIGGIQNQPGVRQHYTDPNNQPFGPEVAWRIISTQIADETGSSTGRSQGGYGDFYGIVFIDKKQPVEYVLTAIEIAFRFVAILPADYQTTHRLPMGSYEAIETLNKRFRQHDVGYAFEIDRLVRIDSQYLHSQAVDPALQLLHAKGFSGAEHEFLNAHQHYRRGENEDAIIDAARAFESTMKQICDEMQWPYKDGATANELVRVVASNGLVPSWHQNHLTSLRTILEGLATVRNKQGGHGAGSMVREVTDTIASFAIHLAASNIVFLVESFEHLKNNQNR